MFKKHKFKNFKNLDFLVYRSGQNIFLGAWLCILLLAMLGAWVPPVQAEPAGGAYELIDAVNQLRAAKGLAPYKINSALMAAAQSHSEYQARTGKITHSGPGGSRPRDRAVANGYGGGAAVFVSENIYGGHGTTPQEAVQYWQGDSLHLTTMLSLNYKDVGAGVAEAGGMVYYTLDAGYIAGEGGSGPKDTPPSPNQTTVPRVTPATPVVIKPVIVSTARPDGSIIHIVEQGQVLITIAEAYHVKLADLYALNGLTDKSVIYPGNKLWIKRADRTPTATPTETRTPLPPTATRKPTRTSAPPTATPIILTEMPTPTLLVASPVQPAGRRYDPLLIMIGMLVFVGVALVVVGTVLKKPRRGLPTRDLPIMDLSMGELPPEDPPSMDPPARD